MSARGRVRALRAGVATVGLLGTAALAAACATSDTVPTTGVEVIIDTDGLTAPADFDEILLQVSEKVGSGSWNQVWREPYPEPSTKLPGTFAIGSGSSDDEALVTVTATKSGAPIVQRVAEVQVPTDIMAELLMVLSSSCVGAVVPTDAGPVSTCPNGSSCQPGNGECGPNALPTPTVIFVPGMFDGSVLGGLVSGEGGPAPLVGGESEAEAGAATAFGDAGDATIPDGGDATISDAGDAGDAAEEPEPACATACTADGSTCVDGGISSCALDSDSGCWVLATHACVGIGQICTGAAGSASCACNDASVCTSTSGTCANSTTVASCAVDNQGCFYESDASTCPNGDSCLDGGTCGACPDGAMQCDPNADNTPALCVNGSWQDQSACTATTPYCNGAGLCQACPDGAMQCDPTTDDTPELCVNGEWQDQSACTAAAPYCNGAGLCQACLDGDTQCDNTSTTPQTCIGGQWVSGTPCGSLTFCNQASPTTCTSTPPSCQLGTTGTTACGGTGDSCCTTLSVTGGSFYRTYTNSGSLGPNPADPASVSTFYLDEYLVTVGRFRQFVSAWQNGYMPPPGSGIQTQANGGMGLANSASNGGYDQGWESDWNSETDAGLVVVEPTDQNLLFCGRSSEQGISTWTSTPGNNENLPMNCITWYEAYAFCIWDGAFLPSQAEWEYAAAGGTQQREYPWGSTAPGTLNQYAIYDCCYPNGPCSENGCESFASLAPVGTAAMGVGLYGQLDLAGEVEEWLLDAYLNAFVDPCSDCAYLASPSVAPEREYEVGDYDEAADHLTPWGSSNRTSQDPTLRARTAGIRCGRAQQWQP